MADNKLFYKVGESNAESFKTVKKDESVIGLINPREGSASNFGYFISGGKQYGPSYHDIEQIAAAKAESAKQYADVTFAKSADITGQFAAIDTKFNDYALKDQVVSPSGTGTITADGVDYIITLDKGVLSVQQYVAIKNVKISINKTAQSCFTASGALDATKYVGSTYNTTLSLTLNSMNTNPVIEAKLSFDNPSLQNFTYTISHAYYTDGTAATGSSNTNDDIMADIYASHIYKNADTTSVQCNGTVVWNNTYTSTISAKKLFENSSYYQFSYTFNENTEGKTTTSYSGAVNITTPSVTCNVKSKSVVVLGLTTTYAGLTYFTDVLYVQDVNPGAKVTLDKTITGIAGYKFGVAVQDDSNYTEPKAKEAGSGFDVENYFAYSGPISYTFDWDSSVHNKKYTGPCTSTFNLYESAVLKADDKIRIVLA